MWSASPKLVHQLWHISTFESPRWRETHGAPVSVQKEQSEHLHMAHCVAACAGLHSGPHVRYAVSPGALDVQASLGGGGGGGSWSKPSQKAQPRQPHSWQCASRWAGEQIPGRQVTYGASSWMPESHCSLVVRAHSLHCLHLHRPQDALPVQEASQSSHLVSCGCPEAQARKPRQKLQSAHLHVSQWAALLASLQCERHAR